MDDHSAELIREYPHSIELSKDAKDVYRWTIKLRFNDGDQDSVHERLVAIDARLREDFSPGSSDA
jgi:hypothetical protein